MMNTRQVGLLLVAALAMATMAVAWVQPVPPPSLAAVPLANVRLLDGFWQSRLAVNREVTIPHIMRQNDATGRVANFLRAARKSGGAYEGRRFNDTDVYKAIEAASYTLVAHTDPALERQLDELIATIAAAQEPDGYLYPARTVDPKNPAPGAGPARWVHLNGSHELYNAGHLYEAAVAHYQATGKRSLLDVAIRNAHLIASVFGPDKRRAIPGHQEIELALVRLFEVTGTRAYLELAAFFLDARGGTHQIDPYPDGPFAMYNEREYKQDHRPVVDQDRAVGHAVRATYMYAAMADVAVRLERKGYRTALDRLYRDIVGKRMYVTGGIGARSGTESFGNDYELPSLRAYTETCAAIGFEQWASRMFRLTGDAQYLDLVELVLYNGALSGVSVSGDRFFYQNPLASDGKASRSAYFDVACCPANLARTLASLPGLMYVTSGSTVFATLYGSSEARVTLGSSDVRLTQRTPYPWDGEIELRVEPAATAEFTVALRIPGWAQGRLVDSTLYHPVDDGLPAPTALVNGQAVRITLDRGFARITREWRSGDVIHIYFPMPVQRLEAHPSVVDARGRLALQRGPVVYAFESADNGANLDALRIPRGAEIHAAFRADLLGGLTVLTGTGVDRTAGDAPRAFMAIPYYAWANRGAGEMRVWIVE